MEDTPSYLRLTKSEPTELELSSYAACRRIFNGYKVTVLALGSIIRQVITAISENRIPPDKVDLWLVSELPIEIPEELFRSIAKTKILCIIEEHVSVGGLGQFISHLLVSKRIAPRQFIHLYAKGYRSKKYGSHDFYLKQTGLDKRNIGNILKQYLQFVGF